MPSRRKTREFVLQVLFAADATEADPAETLECLERHFRADDDEVVKLRRVMMDYAEALVAAVSCDQPAIDKLISKISQNWKLHRISRVDRNILRMAIAEFTRFPDIPGRVILNEAIEIGKKYGAENSGAFINGILDRIHVLQERPASAEQMLLLLTTLDDSASTD